MMSEIGEVQGGRQRNPKITRGEMHPYLRVANIQNGWIDLSSVKTMPFSNSELAIYELRPGDILLTEGQSLELVGRPALYRGEIKRCCFQNTLVRLRTSENDAEFCYQLCAHHFYRGTFARIASQTTSIAHLGIGNFACVSSLVPPRAEQRKIAEILSMWDEALEKLDALIDAKERQRVALMQQLLTDGMRFTEYGSTTWRKVRLSAVLSRVFRPIEWSAEKPLSLVSLRRRCGGLFRRPEVIGAEYKTQDLHELKPYDFLVSKRQVSHGAWALVPPEFEGSLVSKEYAILVNIAPEVLHMPFFGWLAKMPRMIRLARVASTGVHIEKLIFDPDVFLREFIRVPPTVAEQRQIAETLDACASEIRLLRAQRAALDLQKRGLMQRLLTGNLRVKI